MNFRRRRSEAPEINLIPFIDVLLVVLIFLMLSTTYSKFTELQLRLPVADTDAQRDYPKELIVSVSFPIAQKAAYQKFEQPASRFALVGVFVSQGAGGVRVALSL